VLWLEGPTVRPTSLAFAALTTTLSLAAAAFSGSPAARSGHLSVTRAATGIARTAALGPAALRFGRSIGSPTEGHLIGGTHLQETEYLRIEPADTAGDVRWGLEPLVSMLDRAGRTVRRQYPGAVLSVGHLSRIGGGEVDQHRSHESGRDADVGFFVRSTSGKQLQPTHFVPFRGDGTAGSWPGAYFDDAKNWALVTALVNDPEAHVTHVFVAAPLRARLLAYAEHAGASQATRLRAAELMQQPRGALPHDDHFHVRIGCPAHMSGCVENPPVRVARSPKSVAPDERAKSLASSERPRSGARAASLHAAPARALVTPAPKRAPASAPAASPPAATTPPSVPSDSPEPGDPPPALLPAPIDDVDG
jgi:penicillin-insensitive murein endopeptidase